MNELIGALSFALVAHGVAQGTAQALSVAAKLYGKANVKWSFATETIEIAIGAAGIGYLVAGALCI